MEISAKKKRIEKRHRSLKDVLDQDQTVGPALYWSALLIDTIEDVIHSVESLESSVDGVESSTDDVGRTIKRASDSAEKLSKRIYWLTWVLVILGVLALLVAGYAVFCK